MADKIIKNKDGSFGGIKRKRLIKRKQGSKSNPIEDKKIKEKVRLKAPKKRIASIPMPEPISPTKKKLPEKGSKEFFMRGIRKLGKDIDQTRNVLEMFTPIGPAKKVIKKLALRGGGRAYGKNS